MDKLRVNILIVQAVAPGTDVSVEGKWLAAYDPDANDGRGHIEATADRAKAHAYPDAGAALAEWKRVSKTRPLRPDGKPNRPLSAFTVEVVREDMEPSPASIL